MKKYLIPSLLAIASVIAMTGCVGGVNLGGGRKTVVQDPTLGQQLMDLQKARDTGAITPTEYDNKKADLMSKK